MQDRFRAVRLWNVEQSSVLLHDVQTFPHRPSGCVIVVFTRTSGPFSAYLSIASPPAGGSFTPDLQKDKRHNVDFIDRHHPAQTYDDARYHSRHRDVQDGSRSSYTNTDRGVYGTQLRKTSCSMTHMPLFSHVVLRMMKKRDRGRCGHLKRSCYNTRP